jgi:hypothetical protein
MKGTTMQVRIPRTLRFRWAVLVGAAGAGLIATAAVSQAAAAPTPPGLAAKLARVDRMQQARNTAQTAPRPAKPSRPAPPAAVADPAWPSGIQEHTGAPPLPGSVFQSTNAWFGYIGNRRVIVFAGASGSDPSTGEVVVWPLDGVPHTFATPVSEGAVRVTAADGARLTLTTALGTALPFDVTSGQFG